MSWRKCTKRGTEGGGLAASLSLPQARCTRSCPRIPSREECRGAFQGWELSTQCCPACLEVHRALDLGNGSVADEFPGCPRIRPPATNPYAILPARSAKTAA